MTDIPLLPVRMLNEHAYCPRLFALMWVHQEWSDSGDTVRGRTVHTTVDAGGGALPRDSDRPVIARSVELSDEALGLIAKIDLVEAEGGKVVPVDYKKGEVAPVPEGAWEPERIQVCAQALLLRANGYVCDEGALYFAGSRRRVAVPITEALVASTLAHRDAARAVAASAQLPDPLLGSAKCPRCALVGICLPDEHQRVKAEADPPNVRPIIPSRHDGVPLVVAQHGGSLGLSGEEIVISDRKGPVGKVRLADTSRVLVYGNSTVTSPLLHQLARADIPVAWHSGTGWFQGMFTGAGGRNAIHRIAQHRAAADPAKALALARGFVRSKIHNQRVLLRRNGKPEETDLIRMKELVAAVDLAEDTGHLLGVEGEAAAIYFRRFDTLIRVDASLRETFRFERRNRRPPADPVNALLSFAYAVLARELTITLHGVGLDPYVGFLHQPRFGRPALALDLMEEFRPVLADSAVITAINKGEVGPNDFLVHPTGCALTTDGKRAFVRAIERRLDEEATHPFFGTRLSYRRILELQARGLSKVLMGELDAWPEYRVR